MAVAVAHNAAAVPEREAISEEPLESTPGGMDFHSSFKLWFVCVLDVRIAAANMCVN